MNFFGLPHLLRLNKLPCLLPSSPPADTKNHSLKLLASVIGTAYLRLLLSVSSLPKARNILQSIEISHQVFSAAIFPRKNERVPKKNCLPANSRISQLSPFIDEHGFFRLRARLAKATVILYSRILVIMEAMLINRTLPATHSQHQWTLWTRIHRASVQQRFWILKARKVSPQLIRCITCRRQQQDVIQPFMADLPKKRLPSLINFPFQSTGVDYLDFFSSKPHKPKNEISFSSLASSPEPSIAKLQRN